MEADDSPFEADDDYVETWEDIAEEHRIDIAGSIWRRAHELRLSKADVARRVGVDPSALAGIFRGERNITLKTLARLEAALDFRLDDGFRYHPYYKEDDFSKDEPVRRI